MVVIVVKAAYTTSYTLFVVVILLFLFLRDGVQCQQDLGLERSIRKHSQ
jgi:hypothetical protein